MKKLILLAGVAALCGCNKPAQTNEMAPMNDVAMEAEVPAASPLAERSFTYAGENGEAMVASIDADSNYIVEADGTHQDHGSVALNDEGKICFTSAMGEMGTNCWTYEDIAVGAAMDTTSDEGVKLNVTRSDYTPLTMPTG